jgi:hypothetical protein
LLLKPAIGKIKKKKTQYIHKITLDRPCTYLDGGCEGTLSSTLTAAHSTTKQHLGNFGKGGQTGTQLKFYQLILEEVYAATEGEYKSK